MPAERDTQPIDTDNETERQVGRQDPQRHIYTQIHSKEEGRDMLREGERLREPKASGEKAS